MKNFVSNAVLSAVQSSDNIPHQRNDVPNPSQPNLKLVNFSNVLYKTLKAKCNEAICTRKKSARDCHFEMLAYSTIFARNTGDEIDVLESGRLFEMKHAYVKLNYQCPARGGDTSSCTVVPFQHICGEDYAGKARRLLYLRKRTVMKNEAVRRAFKEFLKYGCSMTAKTSLSALITFDAIISDTINSMFFCLPNARLFDRSLSKL